MKLMTLGTIISFIVIGFIFIRSYINDKKEEKEKLKKEELLEKVEKEKKDNISKIEIDDNNSSFDNSINILHDYSSRR